MSTATYKCACCGDPFTARTADRARGWARFCSKRCKAVKQEARTGQHRAHMRAVGACSNETMNDDALFNSTAGWDDHKDWK